MLDEKTKSENNITVPFEIINRESLTLTGGKGANLGELTQAGFPVPPGFCVSTTAYHMVAEQAGIEPLIKELSGLEPHATEKLIEYANSIRNRLRETPLSEPLQDSILKAYFALAGNPVPVAIRSSATAEDLPEASFAGQQDTFLNVIGPAEIMTAIQRCWESLWNDRAVIYRAHNDIKHDRIGIAVVVQKLVLAKVAGVLFTANPLTGKRNQAVINAAPGLGESVVSGATTPDQYIVETGAGKILQRSISTQRIVIFPKPDGGTQVSEQANSIQQACLNEKQIKALTALGYQIEKHYNAPQDLEWAIDDLDHIWLLQSRSITTLFPLPSNAPQDENDLRVYMSATGDEGVNRPFTPMGLQAYRILLSSIAHRLWNYRTRDILAGPRAIAEAGLRFYYDITPLVRNRIGKRILSEYTPTFDAFTANIWKNLQNDTRLLPRHTPLRKLIWIALGPLLRTPFIPDILAALFNPVKTRRKMEDLFSKALAINGKQDLVSSLNNLTQAINLLVKGGYHLIITGSVEAIAGYLALELAKLLLGKQASDDKLQTILRGLPHNPTTEMGLALWNMAVKIKTDNDSVMALTSLPAEALAKAFFNQKLPEAMQKEMTVFLKLYGKRTVAEIDLGLPRWSEDPTQLFGILANYIKLVDQTKAPDVQFEKAVEEGENAVQELVNRAARKSRLRSAIVHWLLHKVRQLIGRRELWKIQLTAIFSRVRELLLPIGKELQCCGRLYQAEDIFFVDFTEIKAGLAGKDLRSIIQKRQESYQHELKRTRVPMILLSDGTEPLPTPVATTTFDTKILHGTPASPGTARGRARIVIDPLYAKIEPGEILVAPSTDPGWTPLFLTAAGLVMERGGAISHGAVVAREFGLPAVVGVAGAIERIQTGQLVSIDGFNGIVTIEEALPSSVNQQQPINSRV